MLEHVTAKSDLAYTTERRARYTLMALSRLIDERFESLRLAGRLAKWYSAIGHEGHHSAGGCNP